MLLDTDADDWLYIHSSRSVSSLQQIDIHLEEFCHWSPISQWIQCGGNGRDLDLFYCEVLLYRC